MDEISSSTFNSDGRERAELGKLLRHLCAFLPLLALIATVNVWVDPAHLFDLNSFEASVGEMLSSGKNVVHIANLNERLVQRSYVSHLAEKNSLVVIGSSRAMQLGREALGSAFQGCRFHNNSVSGSTLGDLIALYGMYRERGMLPDELVIGVDPWVFNPNLSESGLSVVSGPYESLLAALSGRVENPFHKTWRQVKFRGDALVQLASPSYFQASLAWLLKNRNQAKFQATADLKDGKDSAIAADGSRRYDAAFRQRSIEDVRKDAVSYAQAETVYNLPQFTEIDPRLRVTFESFLKLVRADGVKPVLFLASYHPLTYTMLMKRRDTQIIASVEEYVRGVAAREGVEIVGSYDPVQAGLDEKLFFDGMHPRPEAISKLFHGRLPKCGSAKYTSDR